MKKYSLIADSKIEFLGRTLYRIKAEVDFGNVRAGEIGGYIEKEDNLSHYDNAWIYGNAWVFGDAWIYGNAKVCGNAKVYDNAEVYGNAEVCGKMIVTNKMINLIGLDWNITLSSNLLLKIGCQLHTIEEWSSFTDDDISKMDPKALPFWKKYRDVILGLSR